MKRRYKLMPYYPTNLNYNPYLQQNNGYLNPYQNQSQFGSQIQQPMQGQMAQIGAVSPQMMLPGKLVDGIENVRATDTMMDGSVMYFPSTDGQTIFTKQLQSDGRSKIVTYKPSLDEGQGNIPLYGKTSIDEHIQGLNDLINALNIQLTDRLNSIEEKMEGYYEQSNTVGQSISKPTRVSKSSKTES